MEDELATSEAGTGAEVPAAAPIVVDPKTPTHPNGVVVELPCGLVYEGTVHKYAEFVPMHGKVRKAISKKSIRDDFAKVSDMVLRMCVKRIGTVETTSPKTLRNTTLADRDFLGLEIRRASMTDKLRAILTCKACKKEIRVTYHLDEIEIVRLEEADYEIVDDRLCFRAASAEHRLDAVCQFPVGEHQDLVVDLVEENPTDAQYRLYAACLIEWGGKKGPFDAFFFDELPVAQIDEFTRQFIEKKPGPVFDQKISCPNRSCNVDINFTFEGSDFFFPLPIRGTT